MTKTEAQQLIADATADFLANTYNLHRDLLLTHEGDEDFAKAVELLGGEEEFHWDLDFSVKAVCGETTATA